MAEALFHQDWIRQYECTCWGSSRKKNSDDNSNWQGFPIYVRADFKEQDLQIYTQTERWCCLTSALFLLLWTHSEWRLLEGSNEHILKSETAESLRTAGCELSAVLPTASHNSLWDPGLHGNKCNKEGMCQVVKTVKDQTFLFWQGDKGDTKNIWKTNRTETGGYNGTQKMTWISNWTMKILATEYCESKNT